MRAVGKGDGDGDGNGNGDNDGDKDINGEVLNGDDRVFVGRPAFTTEGRDMGDTKDDGIAITPDHEGRASARYNAAELIAFGDGMRTV
ncbi:MAG: hypothetical protein PHS14_16645 [Elusimicrobia bacterium]|nr:hypothetical protein [Elusimicrobiota bacterium]